MKRYAKKTMFFFFPLIGWLLTASVASSDDLRAELQAQNKIRQDQKADRQELQEEQRIERQQPPDPSWRPMAKSRSWTSAQNAS